MSRAAVGSRVELARYATADEERALRRLYDRVEVLV
jgi:hypothetical protein